MNERASINGVDVTVSGRLSKIAKLQGEYFVNLDNPESFVDTVKQSKLKADVFTFVDRLDDCIPKSAQFRATDRVSVMPLSTYDHWFKKQLNYKSRNKLRKSLKAGVVARKVEFSDELILAIKEIYDETPLRQGKVNRHYKKNLETLKREHSAFLDRSDFFGVFYKEEMIGFAKITHTGDYSVFMNIVSKICHRDKAPANLLISHAVEICTARKSKLLMYGVWGARGLNDFKEANGFACFEVPRYYVPLTLKGKLALQVGLHLRLVDVLPLWMRQLASDVRGRMLQLVSDARRRLNPEKRTVAQN